MSPANRLYLLSGFTLPCFTFLTGRILPTARVTRQGRCTRRGGKSGKKHIRGRKGFSFDLRLSEETARKLKVKYISGSRYKGKNVLLYHALLDMAGDELKTLRKELADRGYRVWLADGRREGSPAVFEDNHSISDSELAAHVRLSDIDLADFEPDKFLKPFQELWQAMLDTGAISEPLPSEEERKPVDPFTRKGLDEIIKERHKKTSCFFHPEAPGAVLAENPAPAPPNPAALSQPPWFYLFPDLRDGY